jgi:tetratricopeptide (TPR) repeat protein
MPGETVQVIVEEGRRKAQKGDYPQALRLFEQALSLDPGVAVVWFNKGWVLKTLGRFEEAVEAFDRGLEIAPDSYDGWKNKGIALYKMGRLQDAIRAYNQARALKGDAGKHPPSGHGADAPQFRYPDFPQKHHPAPPAEPAASAAARQERSGAAGTCGPMDRYEEELRKCELAIEVNPDNARAWARKSSLLVRLGRWDEASGAADRALEASRKNDIKAWLSKALVWAREGNLSAVQEAIDRALAVTPSDVWGNTSLILVREGASDEAIQRSDTVLAADRKTYTEALGVETYVSIHLRRYHEALESVDQALVLDSSDPHLWYAKAFALFSAGRYNDALMAVDQVLTIDPGIADAWHIKSWVLNRLGRSVEAEAAEQQAHRQKAERRE